MEVSDLRGDLPARQYASRPYCFGFKGHLCHFWNKDWLSKHKIPIDCGKTSFNLTTLDRNEVEYIAKSVVVLKELPTM
jgi:hypothetical protein